MHVAWRTAAAVILVLVGLATPIWYFARSGPAGGPARGSIGAAPSPAAAVTPRAAPSSPGGGDATLPPISIEESRISGGDPARRLRWDLRAATVETDAARQEVRLRGVEGRFYERGTLVVLLIAPRAIFSTRTQDVTLSGGVRARAPGGRAVEAEQIQWLAARRLLVATGRVRLTQDRITVRADRLESDIGLRQTKLSGNIQVTVRE